VCAHCGYDLAGLSLSAGAPCPECGRPALLESAEVRRARRLSRRYWLCAFLAPAMALPGLAFVLVGWPLLSIVLTTSLAMRAYRYELLAAGRPPRGHEQYWMAAIFGFWWSLGAMCILGSLFVIFDLMRHGPN
jgi:hypothetical protein